MLLACLKSIGSRCGTSIKPRTLALCLRIALGSLKEHSDAPHPLGLLRPRRERPRCRAAECGQQFPPSDGDCHTPLPCEVRKERYHATSVLSLTARHLARAKRTPGIGCNGASPGLRLLLFCRRRSRRGSRTPREWQAFAKVCGIICPSRRPPQARPQHGACGHNSAIFLTKG